MNDDLEQRLAALRPAELPSELQGRLAAPPVARGKIRWLWIGAPLAAAACLLVMFGTRHHAGPAPKLAHQPTPSDYHVYLPVKQTATLVRVEDLAVIDAGRANPIRLVRATWIDDVTYAGDDGHSTVHRREPHAEIIPIALETY